jgi:hypothetical protein
MGDMSMCNFRAIRATLVAGFAITLFFGCAQTRQFTPVPAPVRLQLEGLPANVVEVQVLDLRTVDEPDSVPQVLKTQIVNSLSTRPAPFEATQYRLTVDIIEHRAFFTLGNWNASTRLRARLQSSKGESLGQWDASGTARRSNMFGYATAEAVSQDSYNIAVGDLLSSLGPVSVRGSH